jgi:hypothetical protein
MKKVFGRHTTVPERQLKELKSGVLPPISDSVEIGTEKVEFWYKKINEVVCHRIETELRHGQDFMK